MKERRVSTTTLAARNETRKKQRCLGGECDVLLDNQSEKKFAESIQKFR